MNNQITNYALAASGKGMLLLTPPPYSDSTRFKYKLSKKFSELDA